jgi:hypothetical protein
MLPQQEPTVTGADAAAAIADAPVLVRDHLASLGAVHELVVVVIVDGVSSGFQVRMNVATDASCCSLKNHNRTRCGF